MSELVQTFLASFGFILACLDLTIILLFVRTFLKMKPVISRGMSIMGKLGKEQQINAQELEEVEGALKEGVFSMLTDKYPEVGLVMAYLEENNPEIVDKLADKPDLIVALVKKYAPLIEKLVGDKSGQSKVIYDL